VKGGRGTRGYIFKKLSGKEILNEAPKNVFKNL